MKKTVSIILAVLLTVGCLSACGPKTGSDAGSDKLRIVATVFPVYDWVMNILGDDTDGAEVTLLSDAGTDLHSFQPTAADILKISACDLLIYVGGQSDQWIGDVLKEAINGDMIVIDLLDLLGGSVKEEETVEGMQEEERGGDDKEVEYDEHVWLSLRNAVKLVSGISEAIQAIDPANAESRRSNTAAYIEKLNALDAQYASAVSNGSFTTLLFGDRFPFRYLTDDYGLSYYAAFPGCSAETEAGFNTIMFLSQKADELSLPAIIAIEGSDHKIAETIAQNTQAKNQRILTMDSMQSITAKDIENGATYLSVMEKNLSVLKDALQ